MEFDEFILKMNCPVACGTQQLYEHKNMHYGNDCKHNISGVNSRVCDHVTAMVLIALFLYLIFGLFIIRSARRQV